MGPHCGPIHSLSARCRLPGGCRALHAQPAHPDGRQDHRPSNEQPPKRLDATDGMAVALCHHFTISNPLNAAMGNERVKGLGGGKKAVSKGGSQSWEKFLREHPDREIK